MTQPRSPQQLPYQTDQRQGVRRAASATNAWVWAILTVGYLFPWALAASRGASNSASIFWLNLLTGWTGIGWIAALVMASAKHQVVPQAAIVQTAPMPLTYPFVSGAPLPYGSSVGEVAPVWAPDPTGRHEFRFWDGQRWTDRVADRSVVTSDPITATTA